MDFDEYQELAGRTDRKDLDFDRHLAMLTYGISGESGEFVDKVKKLQFHGHAIPFEDFAKELGDVLWYVARLAKLIGYDLSQIAEMNIAKLRERYPNGFSFEASQARVDVVKETEAILGSEPCEVCRYFDCKCKRAGVVQETEAPAGVCELTVLGKSKGLRCQHYSCRACNP